MQEAQEQLQKKNQELADLYRERSKKLSQMTNLYNLLKARAMRSQMQTAASDTVSQTLNTLSSANTTTQPMPQARPQYKPPASKPRTPKTPSYPAGSDGVEQLHRFQRSGSGSSRRTGKRAADAVAMPPPGRQVWNGQNCRRELFTVQSGKGLINYHREAPIWTLGKPTASHATTSPKSRVDGPV